MELEQSFNQDSLPLAVTMGDPAGIGGELTLKAWLACSKQEVLSSKIGPFVAIDQQTRLQKLADRLKLDVDVQNVQTVQEACERFNKILPVIEIKNDDQLVIRSSKEIETNLAIDSIEQAVLLCQQKQCAAMVTNPIHKARLQDVGFAFPGHTEFLAHKSSNPNAHSVMMLANPTLRTVPVTIHIPLSKVASTLTSDHIYKTAKIVHAGLQDYFNIANPSIAVAGLNPHAGEDGKIGKEDIHIVAHAIERLRGDSINAFGPVAADSLFSVHKRKSFDVAICMYHDQALIPVKTLDFDGTVNITLGLDFIRTSPDHGTAFDIAGKGIAQASSFIAALNVARQMSRCHIDRVVKQ